MTPEEQIEELRAELAQVRADLELCMNGLAALARQPQCACSVLLA